MAVRHPHTAPGGIVLPEAYWRVERAVVHYPRSAPAVIFVSLKVWRDRAARDAGEAPIPEEREEVLRYDEVLTVAGDMTDDDALRGAVYTLLTANGGPLEGGTTV